MLVATMSRLGGQGIRIIHSVRTVLLVLVLTLVTAPARSEELALQRVALAEVVTEMLLETCAELGLQRLRCPSNERFRSLLVRMSAEGSYAKSVETHVRASWLSKHLGLLESKRAEMGGAGSLEVSFSGSVQSVISTENRLTLAGHPYFSSEVLLVSLIHGANTLNVQESIVGSLQISAEGIELLRGFSLREVNGDETLLFEGLLNRALAADEVSQNGASPGFLRERTEWLYAGELVSFLPGDEDLLNVYFALISLKSEDAEAL